MPCGNDAMEIEWDVSIPMSDGHVLKADIFRPRASGRYPVLMCHGPYGKGLAFQDGYAPRWKQLSTDFPEVLDGSSGRYANWEAPDPEKWVPHGYVCIRVDSRGAGRSAGVLDPLSPRETEDYYCCIEWAAAQPWSNGRVGLSGISYYAMNQWQVAALRPPHLAAILPFEGAADFYRDAVRQGGILSTFWIKWYPIQVESVQHGAGERGYKSRVTGEYVAGPPTLDDGTLAANRVDLAAAHIENVLCNDYYAARSAALQNIDVPILSCANWGGLGLHLRGNVEGYRAASSRQKWLEFHGLEHWTHYYTDYGLALQKEFFDHFLKGEDNGWDKRPPIFLNVRKVDSFEQRAEHEWPLARTEWARYHLDAAACALSLEPAQAGAVADFSAQTETLTFRTPAFSQVSEFTGPVAARLVVSSTASDADLFLTLRLFSPDGDEVLFAGAIDPKTPVSQGWLRVSHRKLDPEKSRPFQPWHTHDELLPMVPGERYTVDIEIWPTSIVVPAGYHLALTIGGADFEHGQEPAPSHYPGRTGRGCGSLLHDAPADRDPAIFHGHTSIYTGAAHESFVLLPFIPSHTSATN